MPILVRVQMTQALANLRLSQVRGEEAAKLMCETYRWAGAASNGHERTPPTHFE